MFEQAMAMFSPFGTKTPAAKPGEEAKGGKPEAVPTPAKPDEIGELKSQLASMQAKLEQLSRDRS